LPDIDITEEEISIEAGDTRLKITGVLSREHAKWLIIATLLLVGVNLDRLGNLV